jgi:hypothetical protein
MPGMARRTARRVVSSSIILQPTSARAESIAAADGSAPVARARRQSATSGPTVGSNAPSVRRARSVDSDSTANSSALTGTHSPARGSSRRSSLCGRQSLRISSSNAIRSYAARAAAAA